MSARVRGYDRSVTRGVGSSAPDLPNEMLLRYTDVPEGRVRTRVLGRRRDGVPPVVVVQGMTVSDYLLPACAVLGGWTEVHLLDLPGYAGSGRPTSWLNVEGYGKTVQHWLEASDLDHAVVAGHSSGTQVAAWVGVLQPEHVAAVALASPTIDPVARSLPKLLYRWRLDARAPSPGLEESHTPEWKRAGPHGIAHLIKVHLADRLEDQVTRLDADTPVAWHGRPSQHRRVGGRPRRSGDRRPLGEGARRPRLRLDRPDGLVGADPKARSGGGSVSKVRPGTSRSPVDGAGP
jgi:pimeloyl-ACP methyl ester carboxylesterase